jgi:cytochrome c-type biogenesis protein CcmH
MTRRDLFRRGLGLIAAPAAVATLTDLLHAQQSSGQPSAADSAAQQQPAPLSGEGAMGTLGDPAAAGRSLPPTTHGDNDPAIKAIEQKLTCTCGCTLDIYTCRTTDFTCTYSPRLHREIVAMHDQGKTAQQIVDAFVAQYGEKVLMAPKPVGFNLAGYLVPGAALTVAAGALAWVIRRRGAVHAIAAAPSGAPPASASPAAASPEEMERLARALSEVED